jgi:hypothetical protein
MPDSERAIGRGEQALSQPATWLDTDVASQLAADLASHACRQYRIAAADALVVARAMLGRQDAIGAAVTGGQSVNQIERTRQFKDLGSAVRKKIYYELRRYGRADAGVRAALDRLAAMPPG